MPATLIAQPENVSQSQGTVESVMGVPIECMSVEVLELMLEVRQCGLMRGACLHFDELGSNESLCLSDSDESDSDE